MEFKTMGIEYCVSQLCTHAGIFGIGIIVYIIYVEIGENIVITQKNVDELKQCIAKEKKIKVHKICEGIYIEEKVKRKK